MQRYFSKAKKDNKLYLNQDDIYHIKTVMRMNNGDLVEVVYDNQLYICKINMNNKELFCEIDKKTDNDYLNKYNLILVQSLVKEQKMDFVLQKGTELGITKFIPYQAERSIVKDKNNKKIERWNKICKEASEQSKRLDIPEVTNIYNLDNLLKIESDIKLLCSVNEKEINLKKIVPKLKKYDTIIIVVGPEGGFTNREEDILIKNGYVRISLGENVLRTETAGLYLASALSYIYMEE